MKIFKNLFGNGSKIHSDEIITGSENDHKTLTDYVSGMAGIYPRLKYGGQLNGGSEKSYTFEPGKLCLVVLGYKSNSTKYLGMLGVDGYGVAIQEIYKGSEISVEVDGFDLIVKPQYTARVGIYIMA